MLRTTVYLSEELKAELERAAERSGESEAEIIRRGVAAAVAEMTFDAIREDRFYILTHPKILGSVGLRHAGGDRLPPRGTSRSRR